LKLTRDPRAVEQISVALDVPLAWFPWLAAAELSGAGVLVGIAVAPVGIAAAAGLVLYFVLAITFHVKAHDHHLLSPAVPLLLAAACLVLRAASY
jgi:hypothetical protein